MDERVQLVNEISKLILNNQTDVRKIISEVNRFDVLLEDTIRNFYEIKQDNGAPLFELCEYLKLGVENYGMSLEDYDKTIDKLVQKVHTVFGYSLTIWR